MIIAVGCAGGRIAGKLGLPFAAINTDQQELDSCPARTKRVSCPARAEFYPNGFSAGITKTAQP
jgi:cell division GTPase FtsZ